MSSERRNWEQKQEGGCEMLSESAYNVMKRCSLLGLPMVEVG